MYTLECDYDDKIDHHDDDGSPSVPRNPFFTSLNLQWMRLRLAMKERKGPTSLLVGTFPRRCPAVPTLLLAPWTVQSFDHPCCAVYLNVYKRKRQSTTILADILINGHSWWIPLASNSHDHVGLHAAPWMAVEGLHSERHQRKFTRRKDADREHVGDFWMAKSWTMRSSSVKTQVTEGQNSTTSNWDTSFRRCAFSCACSSSKSEDVFCRAPASGWFSVTNRRIKMFIDSCMHTYITSIIALHLDYISLHYIVFHFVTVHTSHTAFTSHTLHTSHTSHMLYYMHHGHSTHIRKIINR